MDAQDPTARLLQLALLYGVLPLWLLAGFGDWLCHRVQRIEHSAGLKESLLHWLMLIEIGVGLVAALLLEMTSAVFVLLFAACVAHELTTWWDLRYAAAQRRIAVPEQWVHGFQLVLPWAAFATLVLLHPDQALAVIGLGDAPADWGWRPKQPPLPLPYLLGIASAGVLLVGLPFAEEVWRCVHARARPTSMPASAAATAPRSR